MSATTFAKTFQAVFPKDAVPSISPVSTAEEVFVGYKFCGDLQKFLLDYSFKLNSQVPLSDEVDYDSE
jgi:hypothetical protein